jgi:hypothetical protein
MKRRILIFALLVTVLLTSCASDAQAHYKYRGLVTGYNVSYKTLRVYLQPATINGESYNGLGSVWIDFVRSEETRKIDIGSIIVAECDTDEAHKVAPADPCILKDVQDTDW